MEAGTGAEGAVEVFGGEGGGEGAGGDEGGIQEEGVIEVGAGEGEVVDGGEDGAALGVPGAEDVGEFFGGVEVEGGERLVEEEDIGPLGKGAGEEDALLLAAGEFADLAVGEGGEVEFGEGALDAVVVGAGETLPGFKGGVTALGDHVLDGDGKVPVDGVRLG